MKTHWILTAALTVCVSMAVARQAAAQATPRAASEPSAALKRLLDAQTLLAFEADIEKLDTQATYDWAASMLVKAAPSEGKAVIDAARQWVAAFRKAGGRRIVGVVTLTDMPPLPIVAVELADNADEQALAKIVGGGLNEWGKPQRLDNLLVFAKEPAMKRLKEAVPSDHAMLDAAMAGGPQGAVRVYGTLPADTRRVLQEMTPEAPAKIGGGSTEPIWKGLSWWAIGLEAGERPAVKLIAQASDAEQAKALEDMARRALTTIAGKPEIAKVLPDAQAAVRMLVPTVEKDRLVLDLSGKRMDELIGQVIVPSLVEARQEAKRKVRMSTAKMISSGLSMYAGEHKDEMPADLSELVKEKMVPESVFTRMVAGKPRPAYRYIKPPKLDMIADPGRTVVLHEINLPPEDGLVAVFPDGHVEFFESMAAMERATTTAASGESP